MLKKKSVQKIVEVDFLACDKCGKEAEIDNLAGCHYIQFTKRKAVTLGGGIAGLAQLDFKDAIGFDLCRRCYEDLMEQFEDETDEKIPSGSNADHGRQGE